MGFLDLFLLLMLISLLGAFIFLISAMINLLNKKRSSALDWKRTGIFLVLAIIFFVLFGFSI